MPKKYQAQENVEENGDVQNMGNLCQLDLQSTPHASEECRPKAANFSRCWDVELGLSRCTCRDV